LRDPWNAARAAADFGEHLTRLVPEKFPEPRARFYRANGKPHAPVRVPGLVGQPRRRRPGTVSASTSPDAARSRSLTASRRAPRRATWVSADCFWAVERKSGSTIAISSNAASNHPDREPREQRCPGDRPTIFARNERARQRSRRLNQRIDRRCLVVGSSPRCGGFTTGASRLARPRPVVVPDAYVPARRVLEPFGE
jgi:hypothetical protein